MQLEFCIDSEAGLERALACGPARLEVCSRLDQGGWTPDEDLLARALQRTRGGATRVFAMVRRDSDPEFRPDAQGFERLRDDLRRVRSQGAHGAVFGVLDGARRVDRERMAVLIAEARPLEVTFHRAFDRVIDPRAALEALIELGVERVLTSGGAPDALRGIDVLRQCVEWSRGRIAVMPGGGVRLGNAAAIAAATGAEELHGSVPFAWPTG